MASCGAPPATGCGALHLLSAAPSRAQSSATGARHPSLGRILAAHRVGGSDGYGYSQGSVGSCCATIAINASIALDAATAIGDPTVITTTAAIAANATIATTATTAATATIATATASLVAPACSLRGLAGLRQRQYGVCLRRSLIQHGDRRTEGLGMLVQ
eukprot:scaffold6767_cov223-Isochrysis_galbana.AAC.18